ncbi:MAG: DNA topoisomerase I [Candidatus Zambryskibacteria bacterium RIFCSPHIGHO2_01_FULL_43_27]|uniref:DNA topoisomerase 1 n=1 Tax=Candidatus Zambryskibacteria bacterium RIFCSPLOWO2_01_FULL_43_17 TaxID=1802760 RepID=A0A1G2U471_9BACT|nr:MAG: DNA topoisomerase I [Candidatus Zambryskibacteria bacterium RIFCSPHIGHO2_01_FULL_43_27]OHB04307.1 MAG: DNA topoisomerase I [Candidatus Zambryskibacteria bacterium RIFCSPLOWO2_01_FULL_43_17]
MSKKLLIVESPAKAKTIGKYIGDEYKVVASVGHVRDLPKSNKKAIDISGGFIPHYEISKGKEKVISEIKNLAHKSEEILLATDPDREGEAIAWHLAQIISGDNKSKSKKIIRRVTYHEITKEAIEEALKSPREIDINLKTAQEARRVLDRLVGYDLSGLIWKKVRYGLSAGRVQSPALRIIMEREREIRAFKPEDFWVITANLTTSKSGDLLFTCEEEPRELKKVEEILEIGKREKWSVKSVKETEVKRSPRPPFITSTLQQAASSRLGFSPSRTMSVAQKLYEAGIITYMRTDSTNLSATAIGQINSVILKKYGKEYLENRRFAGKSKNAQEAHEAIRPSNVSNETAGINEEQKKLYRLIWERTVASQMKSALVLRTKVSANVDSESIPNFAINGSRILFDGWLKADFRARKDDVELPKLANNDKLDLKSIDSEGKQTEPLPRYSEAGLVKELEKRGIGRPSTYASIIKTLVDRGYVEKQDRALVPTDTGDVVSTFLENNFAKYISDSFTAEMEDELDDIAIGKRAYVKTLKDFYTPFLKEIKSKDKMDKLTTLGIADKKWKCPKCKAGMVIKLAKNGRFLSCERFPECTGARTIDGEELAGPKDTGEICPECGKGNLVERDGRFGRFIACATYPKCKFIKKSAEEEAKSKTGVKCPVCGDGEMVERRGRFGLFYSCSNYPKCKNAIKAKPTGDICKLCGSLMMNGTKTIPERCSNKACVNHNPHKIKS